MAVLVTSFGTGCVLDQLSNGKGQTPVADFKNASYLINGQVVTLTNGVSEVPAAPGSASKVVTSYFGNEARGDLDRDGVPDVGFILTQNSGGSGTFFYAVAALRVTGGYVGTNGVLLGDRIAPQSTVIQDGTMIVNYADRVPGEPFTAPTTVGMSKYLVVVFGLLIEKPAPTPTRPAPVG
jgi:hypothetical protein